MEGHGYGEYQNTEEDTDIRKGPWTMEEDSLLSEYVAVHGEGRWNAAARCAGLKRTGKSCRLRWLNYLRPDVRRGNISLQEQLLILELHSRLGNRWSKIVQHLPGRTDNEIKNYWRTRVQKLAKQLNCDVNSKQFRDTMRYVWMPRLMERINIASSSGSSPNQPANSENTSIATCHSSNQIIDPSAREINTDSVSNMLEWVDQTVITGFSHESFDTQVSLVPNLADYPNCHQFDENHPKSIPNGTISYPVGSGPGCWDRWSVFRAEDSSVIAESWWTENDHENIIWDF